jgi:hypothetical protein
VETRFKLYSPRPRYSQSMRAVKSIFCLTFKHCKLFWLQLQCIMENMYLNTNIAKPVNYFTRFYVYVFSCKVFCVVFCRSYFVPLSLFCPILLSVVLLIISFWYLKTSQLFSRIIRTIQKGVYDLLICYLKDGRYRQR